MSLVNPETGELVDIATREEAETLANQITAAVAHANARNGDCINLMIEANLSKIWVALGYGSWDELVEARRWRWAPLLPADRAAYGEFFRTKGMSYKAIGTLMGRSAQSVRRDIEGAYESDGLPNGSATPEPADDEEIEPAGAIAPEPTETEPDAPGEEGTNVPSEQAAEPESVPATAEGDGDASAAEPSSRPPADVTAWRALFDSATAGVVDLVQIPTAEVLEFADAEQLDDLGTLLDCFTAWVEAIRPTTPDLTVVVDLRDAS